MTTGTGRSAMSRESAVMPSISGMLMSSVITSGWNSRLAATASRPLRAWSRVKSPSAWNSRVNWRRMSAESSTMRSLIMGP